MKKNGVLIVFLWLSGVVAAMQFAKNSSTIELIQAEIHITALYSGRLLSSLGIIGILLFCYPYAAAFWDWNYYPCLAKK